jgi:AraC-like DNA-binding protein
MLFALTRPVQLAQDLYPGSASIQRTWSSYGSGEPEVMTIPAKVLTKHDTEFASGIFPSARLHTRTACREIYTVPVKSAANVIAEACSRVRPINLCEEAGLDSSQLNDPDGRIPFRQLVALYEAAARLTKEQAFGLCVGAKTELRAFDVFGYILMNSANLEEVLNNSVRYFPLWTNGAGFRTERDGSAVQFIWEYTDPSIAECRHDCEMTLLTASKVVGLLRMRHLRPREVHFQHFPPKDTSEHRRLFGTSVHFRMPANRLIFDRAVLASPVNHADRELCNLLIRYANHLLLGASPRLSLTNRAELALRRSLRNGDAQVTRVARSMGMSARTLQRRLRAQGSGFRNLLTKVRQELAEQYLHSEMEIDEISYLLGDAEPSEFHRSFRVWTGITPKQYRRVGASC